MIRAGIKIEVLLCGAKVGGTAWIGMGGLYDHDYGLDMRPMR